jgi:antitoxin component YwqK of YwqJK toxin-antitoxin module
MSDIQECYICYEAASQEAPFVSAACACRGTLAIHAHCFKQQGKTVCSVCKQEFSKEATSLLVRKVLEYDENGKISAEIGMLYDPEMDVDMQHGESKYYFEDGRLWIWCNYNKDQFCGFFRLYSKDGRLVRESWYK